MARRTKAERRLIEFVKGEFGEHLGELLLSGYESAELNRWRTFTVSLTDRIGATEQHSIEMVTDGGSVLPFRKEPLVLASHLKMLRDQGATSRLVYSFPEILRILGWRDAMRGTASIEAALARYYHTSYAEVRRRRHPFAERAVMHTAEQRLIVGYDLEDEPLRKYKEYSVIYTAVDFNPQFLEHLRRRSLFGIDWNLVTGVKVHK